MSGWFDQFKNLIKPHIPGNIKVRNSNNSQNPQINQIEKAYQDLSQKIKENVPKIRNTVELRSKNVVRGAGNISNSLNKTVNEVSHFAKFLKYSVLSAGVGIFFFGVGYAIRPIADIYREHHRTSDNK